MCIRAKAVNRLSVITERIELCSRRTTLALQLSTLPVSHEACSQVEAQAELSAIQCQCTLEKRPSSQRKNLVILAVRGLPQLLLLQAIAFRTWPPHVAAGRPRAPTLELRRHIMSCIEGGSIEPTFATGLMYVCACTIVMVLQGLFLHSVP